MTEINDSPFHSDYEGIAMLHESIQSIEKEKNAINRNFECAWSCIKTDRHEESEEYIKKVKSHSDKLISQAMLLNILCERYCSKEE